MRISEQELKNQYLSQKKSQIEIAKQLGVTTTTIYRYMKHFGILARKFPERCKNRYIVSAEQKARLLSCYRSGLNRDQVAQKENVPLHLVRLALSGQFRNQKQNAKLRVIRQKQPLTTERLQCLLGTLLGDASLTKYRGTYILAISHCKRQKDYLEHKRNIIGAPTLIKLIKAQNSYNPGEIYYKICYQNKGCLHELSKITLRYGHKTVTRKWASLLDWPAIAYWFMDDGTSSYSGEKTVIVRFSTLAFSEKEINLLIERLTELGLYPRKWKHKDGGRTQIGLSQCSVPVFMDQISPYIVPCMRYKIKYPKKDR